MAAYCEFLRARAEVVILFPTFSSGVQVLPNMVICRAQPFDTFYDEIAVSAVGDRYIAVNEIGR